ncbi:MAG: MFS transporter [Chloroflexota bacterium]|nr:MFS transporter [Chloroflexota bacterium]
MLLLGVGEFFRNSSFVVFQYREYRYFWIAAAFSNIGMWALVYGRLWLMHSLTDSPLMVGLTNTATLAPVLVLSVWGGALADRVNRLRLVQFTRFLFAILALLTGVLIASGVILPWHVIAISLATGVLLAFDIPSRSAMMPTLLPREHLAGGIAMYSFVFGGAAVIGPAFFGPLVALWGIEGIFFIIGASYLLTVVFLLLMDTNKHVQKPITDNIAQGVLQGLQYVLKYRVLLIIIILGIVMGMFGTSYEALLPAFADDVLTGGVSTYSRILLAEGIGGICATVVIATLGTRVRPSHNVFVGVIGFGIALALLGFVSVIALAMILLAALGGLRVIFGTMNTTMMQTLSEDEYRGRVMSLHQLTWGSTALGSLMMGALGEGIGTPTTFLICGAIVAIFASGVAFWMARNGYVNLNSTVSD